MTLINDVLEGLSLQGSVFCRMTLSGDWGFANDALGGAPFHLLLSGPAWLLTEGGDNALPLDPGDVVILPRDCGRVVNPRTAISQMYGGVVWAISGALREATEIDPRYGGYLNSDLADYVVAVNADIGAIDVGLIDQPDELGNSVGLKGLGEVVVVGASATIANAIFHATGRRLRALPIRVEDLL